jgi:hypothetical protein
MLKNDFAYVDDAMFRGIERQREIIFYILGIEKSDIDEVA